MLKKVRTIRSNNNKPSHLTGNRKLTRYIHSRSYSKLAGYKGMKPVLNIRRNRLIMLGITILTIGIGLWFVLT